MIRGHKHDRIFTTDSTDNTDNTDSTDESKRLQIDCLIAVTVHSRLTEVGQADWGRVLEPWFQGIKVFDLLHHPGRSDGASNLVLSSQVPRIDCRCIFDVDIDIDVDNTVATAMIDRLMQHGVATAIQSDSFRTKDTKEAT